MRILVDTKDLVGIAEHGTPSSIKEFRDALAANNWELVLTFSTVRELVAPLAKGGNLLAARKLLNDIEQLPLCYLREATIIRDELIAAGKALRDEETFKAPNPYVARWDDTLSLGRPLLVRMVVGMSLFDFVFMLFRQDAQALLGPLSWGPILRDQFEADRARGKLTDADIRSNLRVALKRHLEYWGLPSGPDDIEPLFEWICANPYHCAGFRLGYEVRHEMTRNRTHRFTTSDISDFALVNALPYVDAATVDKRTKHYITETCKRFRRNDQKLDYDGRIFRNVSELLVEHSLTRPDGR